jgi:hypothetical protein
LVKASARLPASVIAFLALLVLGCGAGGGSKEPTAEPSPPADANAIHDVDFAQVPAVQTLARQVGGEPDTQAVQFADLTGDQRDEAIVPITSGGTLGNLGYVVLTMRSGSPVPVLTATRDRSSAGGIEMSVVDGKLVKTAARYGPNDPLCCPSTLIKTTYRWDGSALQVEREEEVQQPSRKQ